MSPAAPRSSNAKPVGPQAAGPKPVGSKPPLTSKQLLALAYDVLEDPPRVLEGRWPRAVALLARQALETTIDDFWRGRAVKVGWASERAKLLCLPVALGNRRLAAEATQAWAGLSRATHQHPYDLAPGSGDLARWLDTVDDLRRAVEAIPAA